MDNSIQRQRRHRIAAVVAAVLLAVAAGPAAASQTFDVTMTTDNAYAIYDGDGVSAASMLGWAENTTASQIWSTESYSLTVPDSSWIYIAAWSDDKVKQGTLADFTNLTLGGKVLSGSTPWQVTATGMDLDNGSPPPTLATMTAEILAANAGTNPSSGWVTPTASPLRNADGGIHGVVISGIDDNAHWMWYDSGKDTSSPPPPGVPFTGFNHDEFLIFRIPVTAPEPSSIVLAAIGLIGLIGYARRRRKV